MGIKYQDIINTVFFLGSVQGLILTFLLFRLKTNSISNHFLGILTFLWAIILSLFALQSHGIHQIYPHLLNTFSQLLFAWFPLLYLSVKYLITHHSRFNKKDLLHFLPMLVSVVLFLDFYFKSASEKLALTRNPEGYYYVANTINEEILSIQGVVYSVIILIVLRNYKERIVDFYAGIDHSLINWMRSGVILILIAWVLGIIGTIIERARIDIGIDLFSFVYLFFVVIIYGISYVALRSGEVYKLKTDHFSELIGFDIVKIKTTFRPMKDPGPDNETHDVLSLEEEKFQNELNGRLMHFMEYSKPYLNPDLSLQSLAEDLSVSRHQLSATINSMQKMNFFDFVNLHRVNEVKQLMAKDPEKKTKNYQLAYDAGFNSKATFYRIFKQFSGQTPSDYRKSIKNIHKKQVSQ